MKRSSVVLLSAGLFVWGGTPGGRVLCQDPVIAYEVPAGVVGNQDFGGALGLDFDVLTDVTVTRLGVFDSGSDGLQLTITARLYDRDTLEELASLAFSPEDQGELLGGSRLKDLPQAVDLPAGFRGTIVGEGYGAAELLGNQGGGDLGLRVNDGGCALLFTGSGRFGDAGVFPDFPDTGPVNRYAAGTFAFVSTEPQTPRGAIAYLVPAGAQGSQDFDGPVGMDFDVNVAIIVSRLGVFDSLGDGLARPITAYIYNRDNGTSLASLVFTPEDPGTLVDGSRLKDLASPLGLPAGFHGSIVAENYGPEEMLGNPAGDELGLSIDTGGCAISPRGSGRFGETKGAYPANPDIGAPNHYAAGTFEFSIDDTPPPVPPDTPSGFIARGRDGFIELTWQPSAGAVPAIKYRVLRSPTVDGAFVQITETAETQYVDSGLPNGVQVCYLVRAVSATNIESFDSLKRCATPLGPLPAGRHIAYGIPEGAVGNQAFGGALGMDFDILEPIRILRLGVFDSGADGLALPITVRIFDRVDLSELAVVTLGPGEPGEARAGSRFLELPEPLDLDPGFQGTISASGYGGPEPNGNLGISPFGDLTTDDGGCRVAFVGTARYGLNPDGYPDVADAGPANRYGAGTFDFEALGPVVDPTPSPPVNVAATSTESQVHVTWEPVPASGCVLAAESYLVLRSVNGGAFAQLGSTTSLEIVDTTVAAGSDYCYRIRSAAGALVSGDSGEACATPGRFIAYQVPGGATGDQSVLPFIGKDFDVKLDIEVTRLGIFDSAGDGFVGNLLVKILDRDTGDELAALDFSAAEPGQLLAGSRFKPLTPPLELSAGLHASIIVEGHTADDPYGLDGPWTTSTGPCSIAFVGRGRSGDGVDLLPPADAAGRPDKYASGTFDFRPLELGTPHGAIAYIVPAGTIGNQAFGGALGMDFDVNVEITVTRLGVFDDGSDGLTRSITARLWDRDTQTQLASLQFTPADPGELVEGSRFKVLDPPLVLPAGFQGVISANGYGNGEQNGNQGAVDLGLVTDDGGCAVTFLGNSRYGLLPAAFPANADAGPANRYAAGTFEFSVEGGPGNPSYRRGDADQNGTLQLTDAVQILGYLFLGLATRVPDCLDAADTDDNGSIQLTDAVRVLGYLFLGSSEPPAPGVTCGVDPTDEDGLDCQLYDACP